MFCELGKLTAGRTCGLFDPGDDGGSCTLSNLGSVRQVEATHPRLGGERHNLTRCRHPHAESGGFRKVDDRLPLRGRVTQGRERGSSDQVRALNTAQFRELGCLAVAVGDRPGFVEQQGRHVSRGLHRAAGHGEHVALNEPVHSGDSNCRQ